MIAHGRQSDGQLVCFVCLLRLADLQDLVCRGSLGKLLFGPIKWRTNRDIVLYALYVLFHSSNSIGLVLVVGVQVICMHVHWLWWRLMSNIGILPLSTLYLHLPVCSGVFLLSLSLCLLCALYPLPLHFWLYISAYLSVSKIFVLRLV